MREFASVTSTHANGVFNSGVCTKPTANLGQIQQHVIKNLRCISRHFNLRVSGSVTTLISSHDTVCFDAIIAIALVNYIFNRWYRILLTSRDGRFTQSLGAHKTLRYMP